MNDATLLNMSNYTTNTRLKSLTLDKKDSSSLNTPGSLIFGIRTKNEDF